MFDDGVATRVYNMTAQMMTALGAFGAMLAFLLAGLPNDTPVYIKLILGAANAGLVFYLGQTNKGTVPLAVTIEPHVVDKDKQ